MWLYYLDRIQKTVAVDVDTVAVVAAADAVELQHMLPNKLWRRPIFSVSKTAAARK